MSNFLSAGAAAILLASCTTYGEETPVASDEDPVASPDQCGAAALQDYVGKPGNAENKAALEAAAKDGFRWIPHGSIITMDYREDRLNVELNEAGIITRIACF